MEELISRSQVAGNQLSRETLFRIVRISDKKRFSISEDGTKIRAAQGHSVSVNLGLVPQSPPAVLYHGTATRFLDSIPTEGLRPQARQQVDLSSDEITARKVGERHGKPLVLKIDACQMPAQGYEFFRADNGVWLAGKVPVEFLSVLE